MKIDIVTLFPPMFAGFLENSIIKRAIATQKVEIHIVNLRDFSNDPHHKVDDYEFGGGSGMVLRVDIVYEALASLRTPESKVIMLTPQGTSYRQAMAYELKHEKHLIFLCGHYEGFDERIREFVDLEISIGDYILTGGELASMVICDSVIRLIDGVIKEESHLLESFHDGLLDYPDYTKPKEFMGRKVPDILLSGDHAKIDAWRREQSLKRTKERRPDLLKEVEK